MSELALQLDEATEHLSLQADDFIVSQNITPYRLHP